MIPLISHPQGCTVRLDCPPETIADFDFSGIFDDDPLDCLDEVSPAANLQVPEAFPPQPHIPQVITPPPPPPVNEGNGFINLFMIVDQRTGQMVCPKQMLTFKNGGSMSTTMVGPSFFQSNFNMVKSHKLQESPITSGMQLPSLHQGPFRPVEQDFKASSLAGTFCPGPLTAKTSFPSVVSSATPEKANKDSGLSAGAGKTPVLRALSAYNFFFQAERDKILNGTTEQADDWSDLKKKQLLQAHWMRDRTKKRRHRKSHGRISFIELSKEISSRWKKLTDDRKEFYREVAAVDFARYQQELKESENSPGK